MTKAMPYYQPASEAGVKLKGKGYPGVPKLSSSGVPYPEPQQDWKALRLAKLRCETCAEFNIVVGACRFALSPDMGCHRFRPGGLSQAQSEPEKEMAYLMRQSAGGTP